MGSANDKAAEWDPQARPLVLWLVAGVLAVVLSIIVLEAIYYYVHNQQEAEAADRAGVQFLENYRRPQEKMLGLLPVEDRYEYYDVKVGEETKKRIRYKIPIEDAMRLTEIEYGL